MENRNHVLWDTQSLQEINETLDSWVEATPNVTDPGIRKACYEAIGDLVEYLRNRNENKED